MVGILIVIVSCGLLWTPPDLLWAYLGILFILPFFWGREVGGTHKGQGGKEAGRHHQAPGRVSASLRHHAVGFVGNCLTVQLSDVLVWSGVSGVLSFCGSVFCVSCFV